jgi:hypothetical protein
MPIILGLAALILLAVVLGPQPCCGLRPGLMLRRRWPRCSTWRVGCASSGFERLGPELHS